MTVSTNKSLTPFSKTFVSINITLGIALLRLINSNPLKAKTLLNERLTTNAECNKK